MVQSSEFRLSDLASLLSREDHSVAFICFKPNLSASQFPTAFVPGTPSSSQEIIDLLKELLTMLYHGSGSLFVYRLERKYSPDYRTLSLHAEGATLSLHFANISQAPS